MQEVWQPVLGYEGLYEVSDHGRVRSLPRKSRSGRGYQVYPGRVLTTCANGHGYHVVSLSRNNRKTTRQVHDLVLTAFIGIRPSPQHDACHNDGNKNNNALLNLRWDTKAANQADRKLHGTSGHGEANSYSKLTENDVIAIRSDTRSQREIANSYGVSQTCISFIKLRKNWAWL